MNGGEGRGSGGTWILMYNKNVEVSRKMLTKRPLEHIATDNKYQIEVLNLHKNVGIQ